MTPHTVNGSDAPTEQTTLVATYLAACALRIDLDMTPRWRRRKRRRIDAALRHACHIADQDVERAGGIVETPLYDLLLSATSARRGPAPKE